MVAEGCCVWDRALDDRSDDFEEGGLAVSNVVMDLVSGKDYKVWFLRVQEFLNESDSKRVSLT